jgi:hypothetical protein
MPNPEYAAAITELTRLAQSLFSGRLSHYQLRRALVEKALGVKVTIKAIADKCEVAEKTADAHWRTIRDWIGGQPKKKAKREAKRTRVAAGAAAADIAGDEEDHGAETHTAIDGIESAARKRADDLLSGLSFIRS